MNIKLKFALIERGIPAYKTSIEAGIHPNRVSKFIAGLATPNDQEKEKLSQILGKPIHELFPVDEPSPVEAA